MPLGDEKPVVDPYENPARFHEVEHRPGPRVPMVHSGKQVVFQQLLLGNPATSRAEAGGDRVGAPAVIQQFVNLAEHPGAIDDDMPEGVEFLRWQRTGPCAELAASRRTRRLGLADLQWPPQNKDSAR